MEILGRERSISKFSISNEKVSIFNIFLFNKIQTYICLLWCDVWMENIRFVFFGQCLFGCLFVGFLKFSHVKIFGLSQRNLFVFFPVISYCYRTWMIIEWWLYPVLFSFFFTRKEEQNKIFSSKHWEGVYFSFLLGWTAAVQTISNYNQPYRPENECQTDQLWVMMNDHDDLTKLFFFRSVLVEK